MAALLKIKKAVGKNSPNLPDDVKIVAKKLQDIGKLPQGPCNGAMTDGILKGIMDTQSHWMKIPDGIITVGGQGHKFISNWEIKSIKAGVQLPGKLQGAWDLVNPLLPKGCRCSSGYRDTSEQRKILQRFFKTTYKTKIINIYGKDEYDKIAKDLIKNEDQILAMVRKAGQKIAKPGESFHEKGKAIDVSGPLRGKQVQIIKLVAIANPKTLTGKILREANGCVHFEIY